MKLICQDFYFSLLVINLTCGSVKLMAIDFLENCAHSREGFVFRITIQYVIIDYVLSFLKNIKNLNTILNGYSDISLQVIS